MLEAYFALCGEKTRDQFLNDFNLIENLKTITLSVRNFRLENNDKEQYLKYFRSMLENIPQK
jgi:hypothetical protein